MGARFLACSIHRWMESGCPWRYAALPLARDDMKAISIFLAGGVFASLGAPAYAERCMAASRDANGEPRNAPVSIDLDREGRLDTGVLPERTSAVMCARSSIVPRPNDIRVLSEWNLPFGIAEEGGRQRSLWISVRAGAVETKVEGGSLSAAERAAIEAKIALYQFQFDAQSADRVAAR